MLGKLITVNTCYATGRNSICVCTGSFNILRLQLLFAILAGDKFLLEFKHCHVSLPIIHLRVCNLYNLLCCGVYNIDTGLGKCYGYILGKRDTDIIHRSHKLFAIGINRRRVKICYFLRNSHRCSKHKEHR